MAIEFDDNQMHANLKDDPDFAEWYVETFLREEMPWTYDLLGAPDLKRMAIVGRRYAEHFGIVSPPHQGMFIAAMLDFGPDFFMYEPMASVARKKGLDEEMRAETLFKLAERHRFEFLDQSNITFWRPEAIKDNILGVPFVNYDEDERLDRP